MLLHPIAIFIASVTAYNIAAARTSRNSLLRYVTLAFLALCAYIFPTHLASFAHTTGIIGRVAAGGMFWNIVSCFDRLVLRQWDYYHYGPVTQPKSPAHNADKPKGENEQDLHYPGTRTEFASEVTSNSRGIGLFWQVKNVPWFCPLQPNFVPSRPVFVLVQSVVMVFCFNLHNMTARMMNNLSRNFQTTSFVPLLTRLHEVSLEEIRVRAMASVGYWVAQYCMMQFLYSAFAIISAISDADSIKLWPPQFGSLSDAYTLRNFWGSVCTYGFMCSVLICIRKFWHQNLRSSLEGVSSYLAHDILQLPSKGVLQRYTKIICSFVISGFMHVAADTGGGLRASESGALVFFPMQAGGIVLEDMLEAFYGRYFGHRSGTSPIFRAIGYFWVLSFLIWTSPVWIYPVQLNLRPEDGLLSLDAIKPVVFGRYV